MRFAYRVWLSTFLFVLLVSSGFSCDPDELYKLILDHSVDHPQAKLPVALPPEFRKLYKRLSNASNFEVCRELWQQKFHPAQVRGLYQKLAKGESLSPEEVEELKPVRIVFKTLRFGFVAFDESHEVPPGIDHLTKVLGHQADAEKNFKIDLSRSEAQKVVDLLSDKKLSAISSEVVSFRPSKKKTFKYWINSEVDNLEALLLQETVTPKEFHEMRKTVSRFIATFDVIQALNYSKEPDPAVLDTIRVLSSVNGKMDKINTEFTTQGLSGEINRTTDPYVVPADLKDSLHKIADFFRREFQI